MLSKFNSIFTERLVLRDFTRADLSAFAAYRNNPEVARYQSWTDYDLARAEQFFQVQQALAFGELDSWYQIAIADKDSGALVGDCVVHFVEADYRQLEIGFTLALEHQRKGYGFEAISALLAFIFGELNTHRVTALTDVLNRGCVGLLERLGFRQEAHFVENCWFKGAWGSEYLYALLNREFNAQSR